MHEELADYVRYVENTDGWRLEVATIAWETPYTPKLTWHVVRTWPTRPTDEDIARTRDEVFNDPRYFRQCQRCDQWCCVGHMHDATTCQSCAERYLGVVH